MERKRAIAIEIGLQTQVLKQCPVHREIYLDDDVDPANAFALAIELVRKDQPYVEAFCHNEHELTDLLSFTLGATPLSCPECGQSLTLVAVRDHSSFGQSALEVR